MCLSSIPNVFTRKLAQSISFISAGVNLLSKSIWSQISKTGSIIHIDFYEKVYMRASQLLWKLDHIEKDTWLNKCQFNTSNRQYIIVFWKRKLLEFFWAKWNLSFLLSSSHAHPFHWLLPRLIRKQVHTIHSFTIATSRPPFFTQNRHQCHWICLWYLWPERFGREIDSCWNEGNWLL